MNAKQNVSKATKPMGAHKIPAMEAIIYTINMTHKNKNKRDHIKIIEI